MPLRGPPSRAATQANGIPPATVPGSSGTRYDVAHQPLAVLGRDPLGRVVGVAAGQRPADVVEDQQRQASARGPVGDQAQLLAERVVVVVAVEDHRVDVEVGVGERLDARPLDQLEVAALGGELAQRRLGRRVDRDDARAAALRPAEQLAGRLAVEGAHLGDRARAGGVEAREEELGRVDDRGRVLVGVGREMASGHWRSVNHLGSPAAMSTAEQPITRESLMREIRARHPRFREAMVADAAVWALYRGERSQFHGRLDTAAPDPAADVVQRRLLRPVAVPGQGAAAGARGAAAAPAAATGSRSSSAR